MKIYKAYWFDGEHTSDMVKVYEGESEAEAIQIAERHEARGREVEVWEGEYGDCSTDALIYP